MDISQPSTPYASRLLDFTKHNYETAPLTCITEIPCKNVLFGFTAVSDFYPTNDLAISSTTFYHDQQNLQMVANFVETLKLDIRYNTIIKMNLEINNALADNFNVKMTCVINSTPFFIRSRLDEERNKVLFVRTNPRTISTDAESKSFWDSVIKATAFQMEFQMSKVEIFSMMNQFNLTLSCSLTYHQLGRKKFDDSRINALQINEWPWEIRYRIEAIKCWAIGCYFLNYFLFVKNEINNIVCKNGFNESWAYNLLTSMFEHIKSDLSLSNLDFEPDYHVMRRKPGKGYVMMKTVYVTPTRVILTLDEPKMSCRGFRQVDDLILIKFRDDNLSFFPREKWNISNVVLPTVRDGIHIAGRQFLELGGSSSLFREQGSYFVAVENKVDIVRHWKRLGTFKSESAAKVAARIGQYFTSARELRFKLKQCHVLVIDDFMSQAKDSAGKPYCFSDGVGIIDQLFAAHIARELDISYIPSAFQIRFAGFKGMVSVDTLNPNLKSNNGNYFVCLRESQKKFEVNDKGLIDFDIVQWSAPAPANFHRPFIAMLDAHARRAGQQNAVHQRLHQLLNKSSIEVIKPLIDNQYFISVLHKLPKYFPIQKMMTKNLLGEPFLRSMVEAHAVFNSKMLTGKTQIPIPHDLGRAAFGIIDTTGALQEGQVFFQFSKTVVSKSKSSEKILKLGRVGVTKSPIYHAGDIQYMTAVDVPALSHLCDVLVFSRRGSRPCTDMIGGGDLDGDSYTIFWDPIFLFDVNISPADYTAPSVNLECVPNVSVEELQAHLPSFRSHYINANNIESLSNCHLAHLVSIDPSHNDCEAVAKRIDINVNFFKSGLITEDLKMDERHTYWPKFMQKRHEPAFTNSHILCQLFEEANTFSQLIQIAQLEARKQRTKLTTPKVEISDCDQKLFRNYKNELQALMKKHQIKSEGELFSNAFNEVSGVLRSYKDPLGDEGSATALIQREVFVLFEKYRTQILDRFSFGWKKDMEFKCENIFSYKLDKVPVAMVNLAKAYYALADDGDCYSFPWIAWEGLDAWWSETQKEATPTLLLPPVNYDMIDPTSTHPTWLIIFLTEVNYWEKRNKLTSNLVCYAIQCFLNDFQSRDVESSVISLHSNVFVRFLMYVALLDFGTAVSSSEAKKFHEAVKCTLVTLAFTPGNGTLSAETLYEKIVTPPPFVIAVPKLWCNHFEKEYTVLKQMSGCEELVIRYRKQAYDYSIYTIMSRGTLNSCKKLEAMLTPVVEANYTASMKDVKVFKTAAMKTLLQELFHFPPLKHDQNMRNNMNFSNPLQRQTNSKVFKRPLIRDASANGLHAKRKPSAEPT